MMKKATLLLQHIETIYPMIPPHFTCVHHGFIAFHHDIILAMGEGEGWEFVDKDTRILEGRNHIAIPGFIDVSIQVHMPVYANASNTLRQMREQGELRMKNATLIGNIDSSFSTLDNAMLTCLEVPYEFDYKTLSFASTYPTVYPMDYHRTSKKRFCISSGSIKSINCLDQLLCAKLYYQYTKLDVLHILAACTIYPAQALHLKRVGSIRKGNIGNVVIMEGQSFEDIVTTFHGTTHLQVIKAGSRILPNILI